ncbi:hypothetical protein EF294_16725 [Gordonia oryzae]|uniref:Uncharacterized protein n=1 Tax=Gordonia oryzae TaxID=2487349 RepID=A0A3N4G7I5_9ACTN|nr:hypothetical protein EF294_16725 [Gordonia oryzae]
MDGEESTVALGAAERGYDPCAMWPPAIGHPSAPIGPAVERLDVLTATAILAVRASHDSQTDGQTAARGPASAVTNSW